MSAPSRLASAAVALLAVAALTRAADPKPQTGFVTKTFKNADGTESPYVVFVPRAYDGTTTLPVILFLHGSGETKGGKKQPAEVGIGPAVKSRESTFPFLVVIPQSEKRTWKAGSDDANRALAMLDATIKEYKGDPARVYLTGLSMGGSGTWSLAAADPTRWAAVAPVCGRAEPDSAAKLKDLPCWSFCGDLDKVVADNRSMAAALEAAGGKPRYTEYKWVGHDSWDPAYNTNQLYTWLLEQKKK